MAIQIIICIFAVPMAIIAFFIYIIITTKNTNKMKKIKILLTSCVLACMCTSTFAQAFVVTKNDGNKIVLPTTKVSEIATTSEQIEESLDYYTKQETNSIVEDVERRMFELQEMLYVRTELLEVISSELQSQIRNLENIISDLEVQIYNLSCKIDEMSARSEAPSNDK